MDSVLAKIKAEYADEKVTDIDGVKVDFPTEWDASPQIEYGAYNTHLQRKRRRTFGTKIGREDNFGDKTNM